MFKLTPALKEYIWGGDKLKTVFNKKTTMKKVAESWELSCHKDGESIIATGQNSGMTLSAYVESNKAVLGTNCDKFVNFPILIKLIDAKDNLSVQVHPSNEYALRVEGEYGKTEMWYIVDCDEGASLLYGFKNDISKDEFKQRIENDTLLDVCNRIEVQKGDVFFIEAGTLHAIGAGIVIAEIQQNSNTTYRIYDYGRVGLDGNPRELHVDKALEVTNLTKAPVFPKGKKINHDGYTKRLLAKCEYFTVQSINIIDSISLLADEKSFHSILCIDGSLTVDDINIKMGESLFVEAGYGIYTIRGMGKIIQTTI